MRISDIDLSGELYGYGADTPVDRLHLRRAAVFPADIVRLLNSVNQARRHATKHPRRQRKASKAAAGLIVVIDKQQRLVISDILVLQAELIGMWLVAVAALYGIAR